MSEAPWKRVERQVAALLGGRRVPVPGRHGPGADPGDVDGTPFYIEVRARKRVDLWSWWHHTRLEATVVGKPPLLVIKYRGRDGELFAVLRLEDLAEVLHAQKPAPAARPCPICEAGRGTAEVLATLRTNIDDGPRAAGADA